MPWCGWCKKMMPEWDAFQRRYKGPVHVEKVDASVTEVEDVKGYPTIRLSMPDGTVVDYDGDRTADAFLDYLSQF